MDGPDAVKKSRHLEVYSPDVYGFDDDLGVESFSRRDFEKHTSCYDIISVRRIAFERLKSSDGLHVCRGMIAKRLRNIRNAGYPVPSYDDLGQDDLWNLLQDIRDKIKTESLSSECHCSKGSCKHYD